MYPNPQDVLPLPPHPNLEQYRKLAKELVKACKSADAEAIHSWTSHWVNNLIRLQDTVTARSGSRPMRSMRLRTSFGISCQSPVP